MIDFSLDFAPHDTRARVFSIQELANALHCSESLVKHMLKETGNPGRNPNGSYELDKWNAFFEAREKTRHLESGDAKSVSLRERSAKAALAELRLEKERGSLVELAVVEKSALEAASTIKAVHFRTACTDAVSRISAALMLDHTGTGKLLEEMRLFHENFCAAVMETFLSKNTG